MSFQIFCVALGDAIKNSFPVDVSEDMTVGHLKKLIKKEKENTFVNVDADTLTLWSVDIPTEDEDMATEISAENIKEGVMLSPFKTVRKYFHGSTSNIRIIVQPPVTTGKRKPDDSDEENESKSSKKMKLKDVSRKDLLDVSRKNLLDISRKIMGNIKKLDENPAVYSNPQNFLSLPFPFPDVGRPTDRFTINNDGFFTFMGRRAFSIVLSKVNMLKPYTSYMKMFVYGTVGYGKSYILAAVTCHLLRSGRRVVYLPDCRELAVEPVEYIRSALFLTYVDDDAKISEINACENFDQIIKFCKSLDERLYFIVDQMNALDELDNTGINLEKKQHVKENIDILCRTHYYIKSSSANNRSALHLNQKQTSESRVPIYGGFDEEEMEEWWKGHNSVLPTMNDEQKKQIEDITGKIPLFLSILLESGFKNFENALDYLNEQLISKIRDPMTSFSEKFRKLGDKSWDFHVSLMSSFLAKGYPPSGYEIDDFDHRFFYIENKLCHYVCGMARDCMANYLYEKGKMEVFTDIKWISCIEKFKNNPSVKGFFVEKACIASIFKNGIMANGVNFKPDNMEFFYDESQIQFSSNEGKCVLYLPGCWNQEAIDGLLISQTNNKLYVAPVQITLNKSSHSDSEGKFFSSIWPNLKSILSGFEDRLKIIFIWITRKSDTDMKIESKSRKTRNNYFEINPDYIQVVLGFRNVNRDIDRYLS